MASPVNSTDYWKKIIITILKIFHKVVEERLLHISKKLVLLCCWNHSPQENKSQANINHEYTHGKYTQENIIESNPEMY